MLVRRLLRQKVTALSVTQDGPPDEMGDPTERITATSTFRGYAWQVARSDETVNTDIQDEEWRLVLDKRSTGKVAGADRVRIEGIDFEVDGPPWPARNPRTSQIELVEVRIRRST